MAQAQAAIDIIARDKASATFRRVGAEAERSSSKMGKAFSGVGKLLGGFSVAAGGAAIAGGLLGIKTAASMEQAKIAFETMLGSAQKADVFLKDLSAFAAKTPFEFPELQTAASSLISAGVEASKVIPIMTTLGDVTSGMGTGSEGVKRATVALQQMNAAGRITGEDLNQLRDAGIPVFDLLAKATGKSKAEVVKLAQAGKLGSKELGQMMKALETGAGLERFSGLMDKQSKSLTGLWSTFKDTLGMGLAKLVGPTIPALKSGLGQISTALGGFVDGVTGTVKIMSSGRPVMETFGLGLRALVLAFKDGDVTSDGFVGKMEQVGVALRGTIDAGKDFVGMLIDAGKAVSPQLEDALLSVGKALLATIKFFNDHRTTAKALVVTLGALVLVTKAHGAALAVSAAGGLASWISGTRIVTALTKTWTAVQWLMNAALTANPIGLIIVGIAALAAGLVFAYKKSETFRNVVHGALHGVAVAVNFVKDHWKAFAVALAFLIGGPMIGAIVLLVANFGKIKAAAASVSRWVTDKFGALVGFVTGLPGKITSATRGMFDGIKSAFRSALNFIIRGWNRLEFKIPGFDPPGPGPKFGGMTIGVPNIPLLGNGGNILRGGSVVVGDAGPEILDLPRGATVTPLGRGGGDTYYIDARGATAGAAREIVAALKRHKRETGVNLGLA